MSQSSSRTLSTSWTLLRFAKDMRDLTHMRHSGTTSNATRLDASDVPELMGRAKTTARGKNLEVPTRPALLHPAFEGPADDARRMAPTRAFRVAIPFLRSDFRKWGTLTRPRLVASTTSRVDGLGENIHRTFMFPACRRRRVASAMAFRMRTA